jgi:hypothetical protein
MANYVHMSMSSLKNEGAPSPLELFTGVGIRPKISSFHPFGCPIYVLDSALALGKSLPKWEDKAHVGIYLGPSPRHSQSVALVLLLNTGLVSPQYHVVFDDHFQIVHNHLPGSLFYKSDWQALAGLELDLTKLRTRMTKRSGCAAQMMAQMTNPVFPGQGCRLMLMYLGASEEEDVLPPEGADDESITQHPAQPIEPDPDPEAQDVLGRRKHAAWSIQQTIWMCAQETSLVGAILCGQYVTSHRRLMGYATRFH